MKASSGLVVILGCIAMFGCNTNAKQFGTLETAGEDDKLFISFEAAAAA